MDRAFQLQQEKNSGIKNFSYLKPTVSAETDLSNPLQSAILSMQKTYGNRYVQELVSGERMPCPELCGLKGPLILSPTRPAAQFKPHSCDSCLFHPQRSVKRVAAGAPNLPGGIPFQAKLKIGQPGDVYEQEADRVADMVLQTQCTTPECEEEEKIRPIRISPLQVNASIQMQEEIEEEKKKKEEEEMLQMRQASGGTERDENVAQQILQQKGSGRPLEPDVKEFMESRFGYDFGEVRVHTDSFATKTTRNSNAEAFTVGRDVYFGAGRYDPTAISGQRLLVHELTHVLQQGNGKQILGVQCWSYGRGAPPHPDYRVVPKKDKPIVEKARSLLERVVTNPKGYPVCHKFFKNNCPGGTDKSLTNEFNGATLWFDTDNTFWGSGVAPNHVAYSEATHRMGRWFIGSVMVHELMHRCGQHNENTNDKAILKCGFRDAEIIKGKIVEKTK